MGFALPRIEKSRRGPQFTLTSLRVTDLTNGEQNRLEQDSGGLIQANLFSTDLLGETYDTCC